MAGFHQQYWDALERWSPTLFLAAGGAWIIDTAPYAVELAFNVMIPATLSGALLLVPLLLTDIAAVGLYPARAEETPRLALGGTLLAGFAGIVTLGGLVWVAGASLLGLSMPPVGLLILIIVLPLLSLVCLGLASVRTAGSSRACGVLLLALATMWTIWIAGILGVLNTPPDWASAVLGMLLAVTTASIGVVIRIDGAFLDMDITSHWPTMK